MKQTLLTILLAFMPLLASADVVEINGIYYNLVIKGKVAEVTNSPNLYSGNVVIPDKIVYEGTDYVVTIIGGSAFQNCSSLTSVTIPNSVTTIGNYAFSGCSGLTSVTIPNSVTSIGEGTFMGCGSLTSVHISDIAAWCNIKFGDPNSNPLHFAHHLFVNDEEVKDLIIPNFVISIGDNTFSRCSGLTSVTIPFSVTSIGSKAFSGCSGLTSVTISNSVTNIESEAFSGCSGLTLITIPNSVISIGDYAFYGCSGLNSVIIPNSVTSIGEGTFGECSGLETATIPNSVTSIESRTFYRCSSLTSVIIGNSVTSIGFFAFNNCSGLTSVTIPNSVTSIGEGAFSACSSLTSVSIPSSVTSIADHAFAGCDELSDVICFAENVPSTWENVFKDSYIEYATLYVPANSMNAYKATSPWSGFGKFESIEGGVIEQTKCATPTISYGGKKLSFSCDTEGVEYVSEIKDIDVKKFYDNEISLSATYKISVYATKPGYEDSDITTATLVWGNASFTENTIPSSVRAVTQEVVALITTNNGIITICSDAEDQPVTAYAANGQILGSSAISGGRASIPTTIQRGSIAIVKIGNKSVKIAMN